MVAFVSKRAIVHLDVEGTATQLGEVRSFNIETTLGTIDVSTIASDWKKYLVGQVGWSGTMELFYDPTDEAQEDLATKALAGTMCSFTFLPFDANERYRLWLGGATGGSFTLGDGETIETTALTYNATAAQIAEALNTAYTLTGVTVVPDIGNAWVIEFPLDVEANLQITNNSLTGTTGTPSCALITERYEGDGYITSWTVSGATEDAVGLSISVQGNEALTLNA
ncbi:MAG TPA: hypothetical protein PK409_09475 [Thermosynergistes sp.]|nr:hypothetical protein [Thermosynergistes sp.]HQE22146.1 hypothetical protein [Thermosynergistes sp.]